MKPVSDPPPRLDEMVVVHGVRAFPSAAELPVRDTGLVLPGHAVPTAKRAAILMGPTGLDGQYLDAAPWVMVLPVDDHGRPLPLDFAESFTRVAQRAAANYVAETRQSNGEG